MSSISIKRTHPHALHRLLPLAGPLLLLGLASPAFAQIRAFPGAEGYGAYAVGGRNGDVYHVTNLNASGPGSFAEGLSTVPSAGRTIVFDVSGYIRLPSGGGLRLTASKVTIAGQTAPGDGIGFYNSYLRISSDDTIIRHVRFRHGKYGSGGDCIDLDSGCLNAILDHITMQFSTDENMSSFGSPPENITLQHSINAWGLESHSCGGLWDQNHASSHHNLWAHNHTRNPKARPGGLLEWVNNVTFDWDIGFIMGDSTSNASWKANVLNNYFISPPGNTQSKAMVKGTIGTNGKPNFTIFLSGNKIDNDGDGILNGIDKGYSIVEGTPFTDAEVSATVGSFRYYQAAAALAGSTAGIVADDPLTAYKKVVSNAGALRLDATYTGAIRDEVDTILINKLTTQTAFHVTRESGTGASASGFGVLNSTPAPVDTDKDGMPDFYEDALGWSKTTDDHTTALANSGGLITGTTYFPAGTVSGYTRLEEYLHYMAIPHATVLKSTADTSSSLTINLGKFTSGFSSSPTFTVSNVVGGTVVLSGTGNATATFTPTLNYSGRGRFEFTVTDSDGSTWTQTFALLVSNAALPRDLIWKGVSNAWDITTATNWLRSSNNTTVTYSDGDRVTFDQSGIAQPNVVITGTLSPTTLEVNSSTNYSLSGPGTINSTGTLTKRGSSTLNLGSNNTYAGGGTLEQGTINLADSVSLAGGTFTLYDGTILQSSSSGTSSAVANPLSIPAGNTATVKSGNRTAWNGAITGAGTLNFIAQSTVSRADLKAPTAAFTGNYNFSGSGILRLLFNGGAFNGFDNSNVDVSGSVNLQPVTNSGGNTLNIGSLSSSSTSAVLAGGTAGAVTYIVGSKGTNTTFAGSITGNAVLTKTGAGTLTLTNTGNNHTGATNVNAGELAVVGSLANTAVTVASGAKLSGAGTVGGSVSIASGGTISPGNTAGASGNLTVGSLALTTSKLAFDLTGSASGNNDHIQIASGGALALTGAQSFQINLVDGLLNAGTYKLIETTGTLTASSASLNLSLPTGSGARQSFTMERGSSGTAPGYVQLVVSGNPASLAWTGAGGIWDTTSNVWTNGGGADKFYNFDAVSFDDSASTGSVTLLGTVQPRSLMVNNSTAKNYTFSGSGRIGGITALTKTGTGTLTINVAPSLTAASTNTASSSSVTVADATGLLVGMLVEGNGVPSETVITAISGTTLTLSNSVTAANSAATFTYSWKNTFSGGTTIGAGSTIILANDNANAYGLGTGAITFNSGILSMYSDTSSYNAATYNMAVPSGQTGRLNADARCDLYGTLTGAGTFNFYTPNVRTTLFSDWSAFSGALNVITDGDGGDLRMGTSYGFPGFPLASVNLADKISAYYIGTLSQGVGTTIEIGELSGGSLSKLMGGATGGRNFTYRVGAKTALANEAVFAGTISEQNTATTTSFVKTGAGTWTLSGACNWNGSTTIEQGTLKIIGSLSCISTVNVAAGATLNLAGGTVTTDTVNISSGASLIGYGTITGDLSNDSTLTFNNGGQVTITGNVVNNGTMRFTGGTALNATGSFTNNGVLDLLTGAGGLPANLVNNGVILDSSAVKVKGCQKSGNSFSLTIDSYSGHTYKLQRNDALSGTGWQDVGSTQPGVTQGDGSPTVLTFSDTSATATKSFYRIQIDP